MVIEFFMSILEIITYILFSYLVFNSKLIVNLKRIIFAIIIYFIIYLLAYSLIFSYMDFVKLLCIYALFSFFIEGPRTYKIRVFGIGWLVAGFLDILVYASLNVLFDIQRSFITEIFSIITNIFIWILLYPLTSKHIIGKSVIDLPKIIYLNVLMTCFSCSTVLIILIFFKFNINKFYKVIIIVLTLITLVLSLITVFYFVQSNKLKYFYLDKSKLLEQDLKLQNDYFLTLHNQYKKIRSLNHDFNAHIFCLKSLVDNKDYTSLKKYLDELIEKSNLEIINNYCSDPYIASILYNLSSKLENENINFEFIYLLPREMLLTPTDKSSLFYNLMMNSIEACEKVEGKRKIKLMIESIMSTVLITIQNSVNDNASLVNFLEKKTSKKDTILHGIGLSNIYNIIENYDGCIEASIKDGIFQINIIFYNCL